MKFLEHRKRPGVMGRISIDPAHIALACEVDPKSKKPWILVMIYYSPFTMKMTNNQRSVMIKYNGFIYEPVILTDDWFMSPDAALTLEDKDKIDEATRQWVEGGMKDSEWIRTLVYLGTRPQQYPLRSVI